MNQDFVSVSISGERKRENPGNDIFTLPRVFSSLNNTFLTFLLDGLFGVSLSVFEGLPREVLVACNLIVLAGAGLRICVLGQA